MKTYYTTNFDFYYDENMMDIPQAVLESEQLSPAAKKYLYLLYLFNHGEGGRYFRRFIAIRRGAK